MFNSTMTYRNNGKIYVDYRIKPNTPLLLSPQPPSLLPFPLPWVLPGDNELKEVETS